MALVVLLRGVNVGGHRSFRPKQLAAQLKHLDAVNIGAAGTFVIRKPITRARLRDELTRRLPFVSEIVICEGRDIRRLLSRDFFGAHLARPDTTRFVSVLSKSPRSDPSMPVTFPATGRWLLKVLSREGRFVVGVYRRHMKVIGYLGALDAIFGARATTRSWSTLTAIANALDPDLRGSDPTITTRRTHTP